MCLLILYILEPEKKSSKQQTSVYLRHWKPDEYELGELKEVIVEGNSFESLLAYVSVTTTTTTKIRTPNKMNTFILCYYLWKDFRNVWYQRRRHWGLKGKTQTSLKINKIQKETNLDYIKLKCKRDYPYNSPILDLHKDMAWKDNYFLQMEKLEDGVCFYFR